MKAILSVFARITVLIMLLLITFSFTVGQAVPDAAPKVAGRVERTAADIAAIRQLDANLRLTREATSNIEIPLTINVGLTDYVHCSDWVNAGMPINEVITMDFKDYVKNVLPNEWSSIWSQPSLQSGAMAAKTFAWWRINLVDPRPQGADVVDNTCDQVFFQNSQQASTDTAVDATWHIRMSRENQIIGIHYLAWDYQCADLGWDLCMGQNETQEKALAGWAWQDILHFYYDPIDLNVTSTIAPNVNLVTNSSFENDLYFWFPWGGIAGYGVSDGVFHFYRSAGSANPAVLYQDLNVRVPEDTPMRVNLLLGNSSNVEKTVTIHLHDSDIWDGAISCEFTLYPGLPMQKYLVYGSNPAGWVGMRLEITGESDDGLPAYLVDKVKVNYKPAGQPDDVPACAAPAPGRPVITAPVANTTYGKQVTVNWTPGASNLRPGYDPAYQMQISKNADFSSTVFDNAGALATDPTLAVTLTDGQYYVRVRQFDGVDRFSRWSKPVAFKVVILPGIPVIIAPAGTVNPDNLTFSWSPAVDSTSYKLNFKDAVGAKIGVLVVTPAAAGCADEVTTCSIPAALSDVTFVAGQSYAWRIIAKNANGKTKSTTQPFSLTASGVLIEPPASQVSGRK